jgi:methionine synthase II (cobalamin-independent)
MDRAESFRDMCEELADAEMALARVDETPLSHREERRAEWQALVDRLVGEVETELRGCNPSKLRTDPSPRR